MLAPLALAFQQILILRGGSRRPTRPTFSRSPGERLARGDPGRSAGDLVPPPPARAVFPKHPVWGVERPALETWTAILAFAPLVGWLGNPAWWRETLPRLAHYYMLNTDRRGCAARHPDHLLRSGL